MDKIKELLNRLHEYDEMVDGSDGNLSYPAGAVKELMSAVEEVIK